MMQSDPAVQQGDAAYRNYWEFEHTHRDVTEVKRQYDAVLCLDVIEHLPLNAGSLTNLATIEYWLNGTRFSVRLNPPYTCGLWLERPVCGRDGGPRLRGKRDCAQSSGRFPSIDNDRRPHSLFAGDLLPGTQRAGRDFSGSDGSARQTAGANSDAIDGYQQPPYHASTFSYSLDTTSLSNGKREIMIAAFENSAIQQDLGMLQFPIQVDNGITFQQIRAKWRDVYLAPGETQALQLRQIFTDATEEPVSDGPVFSSDNPVIASVDDAGLITGVSRGFTRITGSFAHFSRNGIIGAYDPSRSMFLRTLSFLDYSALAHSPNLAGAAQNAAVNALTEGLYINPADGNQPATFESWREQWDALWGDKISAAQAYEPGLFFTGDDMAGPRQSWSTASEERIRLRPFSIRWPKRETATAP